MRSTPLWADVPNLRKAERDFYRSRPWRLVRLMVLERDGYKCQIQAKHCTTDATQVDHIIPLERKGNRLDPDNLRAACAYCNSSRTANLADMRWKSHGPQQGGTCRPYITLVVGPPGGGKSTWAKGVATEGDVVIDLDDMVEALGGKRGTTGAAWDAAMGGRGAVIKALRRGELDAQRCYIVSANPKAESFMPYHEVKLCDPGEGVARQRNDGRGGAARVPDPVIADWYRQRASFDANAAGGPSRAW